MEKAYWIGRNRAAMGMARTAATAEARLVHHELDGRYSGKAAQRLTGAQPAAGEERAVLHLPNPALRAQLEAPAPREGWGARKGPVSSRGAGR